MTLAATARANLRSAARALGFHIQRVRFSEDERSLTCRLIDQTKPTTVIDVGANVGQFASGVLATFGNLRVVSFEPEERAQAEAIRRSRRYPNWVVGDRVAVGAEEGRLTLHVAGNSQSSSLLEMTELHEITVPGSKYQAVESVPCRTLDSLLAGEADRGYRYYLKIDTQGYEMNVLRGAQRTLERVVAIQCEVSFDELYVGQPLAAEVVDFVTPRGFSVFAYANGLRDPRDQRLLQADIYFIRTHDE